MREALILWYRRWLKEHEDTNLIYSGRQRDGDQMVGKPSLAQVSFMQYYLSGLFWSDIPYDSRPKISGDAYPETVSAWVIGEHRSKSVRLPVFLLEREDEALGLKIVLRYNFHDWNVSVVSDTPILNLEDVTQDYNESQKDKFKDGYIKGHCWGYCFFQGFPDEYWFGPYRENNREFSAYFGSDYEVYTFIWLLLRELRRK